MATTVAHCKKDDTVTFRGYVIEKAKTGAYITIQNQGTQFFRNNVAVDVVETPLRAGERVRYITRGDTGCTYKLLATFNGNECAIEAEVTHNKYFSEVSKLERVS